MANVVTMTYGSYSFTPVPLISIERTTRRVGGEILGYNFQLTLNGTVTSEDPNTPGAEANFTDNMTEVDLLRAALASDCEPFEIKCDVTTVLSCFPKVESLTFQESNNNWVNTIPFTAVLSYQETNELSEAPADSLFIENVTQSWNMEFVEDSKYFVQDLSILNNQEAGYDYVANDGNNPFEARITRTISVQGIASCSGSGAVTSAVENARTYVTNMLTGVTYDASAWGHSVSGITNLTDSQYEVYDHFRSHVIDENNGSIEVTENWLVLGTSGVTGTLGTREDFTVTYTKSLEDSKHKISIEGQIQGFESRTYNGINLVTPVTGSAYGNASSAWSNLSNRLFPRAQAVFQANTSGVGKLNPEPLSKIIGHQHSKGIITYNYEFDNRPCSFISGSLTENISINDSNPTDVFANLVVLGRPQGPILQPIGTPTAPTREVTVEVTMPGPTGCQFADLEEFNPSVQVNSLLCNYESGLVASWDDVLKNTDSVNWNPLTGRYSRTVGWTLAKCSGNQQTAVCSGSGQYI